MYVCMYVCIYVCTYVWHCMNVFIMYICLCVYVICKCQVSMYVIVIPMMNRM